MRESPSREIYLRLDAFGARLGEYMVAVRWLCSFSGLRASRVDAYYRAEADRALLRLRFEHPQGWEMSALAVWAHCEGFRLAEPEAWAPGRYREFFVRYLPRFELVAEDCGRLDFALVAVGQHRHSTRVHAHDPVVEIPDSTRPAQLSGEISL